MNSREMEKSQQAGFARIVADNGRTYIMTKIILEIGRDPKSEGPEYFCLAESNTISKNHARIEWN